MDAASENKQSKKKRGAGGRPEKETHEKATYQAKTLLNEVEWTSLKTEYEVYAYGRSKSFSAFLKERLLNSSTQRLVPRVRERETAYEILYACQDWSKQLEGLARNYNQLVKRVNSLHCSNTLQKEVQKGNELLGQIAEELQQIDQIKQQIEAWLSGSQTEKM